MRARPFLAAALLALAVAPAALLAQSGDMPGTLRGSGAPGDVKAGTYAVEPQHTQVIFSVSHLGISPFAGTFSGASGSLTLDPANLAATKLTVTIPTASVATISDKLTGELKSADWLDAGAYPTASFTATAVKPLGGSAAEIAGDLTLHGVTKPITIVARFFGAAQNPMSKKDSVGFLGRATIKRSDFGVSKYVPMISDDTVLVFNAAFERQ